MKNQDSGKIALVDLRHFEDVSLASHRRHLITLSATSCHNLDV